MGAIFCIAPMGRSYMSFNDPSKDRRRPCIQAPTRLS